MVTAPDYADVFASAAEVAESGGENRFPHEESPTVHVKLSPQGPWHRIAIDLGRITSDLWASSRSKATTACGRQVTGYYSLREESYAGHLCIDCFHPHEFVLAAAQRDRMIEADDDAEREQDKLANDERRARNQERLDLATGKVPKLPKPEEEP